MANGASSEAVNTPELKMLVMIQVYRRAPQP